jgi:hypothetical protein
MSNRLHIWIGNPQSPDDLSLLLSALGRAIPEVKSRIEVVFENKVLEVSDLADGFTDSDLVKENIENAAKRLGVSSATAMFGCVSESIKRLCPAGLRFLGSFATMEDEAEFEVGQDWGSLYRAVIEGDLAVVKLMLKTHPESLFEKNEVGHDVLMASATTERADIAEVLLSAGARVHEVTPENGYTALHWAVHHKPRNQQEVTRVVELLVKYGSEVNAVGRNGVTPLMLAAWFGAGPAAEYLLMRGADRALKDAKGKTAREMAVQRGHLKTAELLAGC